MTLGVTPRGFLMRRSLFEMTLNKNPLLGSSKYKIAASSMLAASGC